MGQKKLQRFAGFSGMQNTLEYPIGMPGKWNEFFKNDHPITLELACGKGEYTTGLANLHANRNFIGIDIKGNRMWVGATKAQQQVLTNVGFLRCQIEKINEYFAANEVAEIWITFPDPQLRTSKAKKRLTHPRFLKLYRQILQPAATINLKTDSPDLYHFTKTVINLFNLPLLKESDDLYASDDLSEELKIKTHYEKLDIAKSSRIHYLKFAIDKALSPQLEEQLKQMLLEEVIS